MRGIKIPQYEFALKLQGGLMREGGRICETLRYLYRCANWSLYPGGVKTGECPC